MNIKNSTPFRVLYFGLTLFIAWKYTNNDVAMSAMLLLLILILGIEMVAVLWKIVSLLENVDRHTTATYCEAHEINVRVEELQEFGIRR